MGHVLTIGNGGDGSKRRASRARATSRAGSEPPRVSLYDEVTARIIAELGAGRFPWVQPWSNAAASPGLPRNATTGRAYSGVNVLILWGAVIAGAYARTNDPFASIGKVQVAVDVGSVIRASATSFRVAWTERAYRDGSLAETTRWSAILTIAVQTPRTRALRAGSQDTINQAGQQIVRRQLNVAPTLKIRPGFPLRVIVTRDLILAPIGGGQ